MLPNPPSKQALADSTGRLGMSGMKFAVLVKKIVFGGGLSDSISEIGDICFPGTNLSIKEISDWSRSDALNNIELSEIRTAVRKSPQSKNSGLLIPSTTNAKENLLSSSFAFFKKYLRVS